MPCLFVETSQTTGISQNVVLALRRQTTSAHAIAFANEHKQIMLPNDFHCTCSTTTRPGEVRRGEGMGASVYQHCIGRMPIVTQRGRA